MVKAKGAKSNVVKITPAHQRRLDHQQKIFLQTAESVPTITSDPTIYSLAQEISEQDDDTLFDWLKHEFGDSEPSSPKSPKATSLQNKSLSRNKN